MTIPVGGGWRRCLLCGAAHTACGSATSTTPVDERVTSEVTTMAERKQYRVRLNGTDTVMNLTEEDAATLYPDNAELIDSSSDEPAPAKARATSNKARTTENK